MDDRGPEEAPLHEPAFGTMMDALAAGFGGVTQEGRSSESPFVRQWVFALDGHLPMHILRGPPRGPEGGPPPKKDSSTASARRSSSRR